MARLWHAGAEIDAAGATNDPDGAIAGTVTRDTVTFRSGLASWKLASGGGTLTAPVSLTASATNYCRAYFNISGTLTSGGNVVISAFGEIKAQIGTAASAPIYLLVNGVQQGSSGGAPVNDGAWHRVELSITMDGSGNATAAELRLDGASIATWSGTQALTTLKFAHGNATGMGQACYLDDIAVNNSSGAVNNSWPGEGRVVLLLPVADSAVGASWTNDAASAVNIFNAVKNTPPQGIADTAGSTGLHQIRNAGSAASSYDAQLGAYSDTIASGGGGMRIGDVVNALTPCVTVGAPVVTGAKTGSFGIVSNPAITNRVFTGGASAAANFWGGAAPGTYGSNWRWEVGTLTEAPSVVLATKPVARLTITGGTAARIAMSCAVFLYVEYTPAHSLAHSPRRRNLVIR